MVCLGGRHVRPLDALTQMLKRTKASPGDRIHSWSMWRIPKSTSLEQKIIFTGIKKKGERADLKAYLEKTIK